LILADEPTGNLDVKAGAEIMHLLEGLHGEGRTILMVTHDDTVASYASRAIFLRDGQVIADRDQWVSRAFSEGGQ
jgi:ABC-type lipoprotein export system ATPase subunit